MDGLQIRAVTKSFTGARGLQVTALRDLSLDAPAGCVTALLGPSGCGKSTLLSLIAGFEAPDAGEVRFCGAPLGDKWSMVFQSPALFDWLTVRQNVEFGLKRRKYTRAARREAAGDMLAHVGLEAFADAYPDELSGGMQQRAALARALVLRPEILLMDEPFAALDAQLREKMQELLLTLQAQTGQTILFVTHDIEEALRIAHRVIVLSARPGRVCAQFDLPPQADERSGFRARIRAALESGA